MPVTSATSTSTSNVGYSDLYNSTGGAARKTTKVLGSDDFMKLLAVQFQQQDPMKPMEDTAFIAQMAQFSALEQNKTMASQITALRADQQLLMGNSYLGRTVTVEDADGKSVTGLVTALDNDATDGVTLSIDGKSYPLSSVRRIEPTVTQQSSTATDGTAA
ncbi:flagellar hook capping FlgD N-terminal domain-containing protein [Oleiharenicola sp. Vm1]|uniref:flagellar hook capping FlgD N-terminal domain-containing protein n=1 Tax=Oleiharenicola sp. Vm1 TaxID=3398393 RepID=UPI0039F54B96